MANSESPGNTFNKNMQALRQTYLKRLSSHVQDFTQFEDRLAQGVLPPEDFQQLYRLSHNFAGSGSTFGFASISESAANLYRALGAFIAIEPGGKSPVELRTEMLALLQAFIGACNDAIHAQPAEPEPEPPTVASPGFLAQETLTIGIWKSRKELVPDLKEKLMHFGYHVVEAGAWQPQSSAAALPVHLWLACSDLSTEDIPAIDAIATANPPEMPRPPLVVLSTRNDFETRLTAVRCGAQGYFLQSEDILRIIERIERLAGKQMTAERYRILIIDDDEILSQHYRNTLSEAGMEVIAVHAPEEGLKALAAQVVDLVLLDYTMPHCNGQELASVIRQHATYVSLPIIFMSAKDDIETQLRDTSLGIDDFLIKPIASEQLVSVVRSRAKRSAELRSLMVRDNFTGLLSHAYFQEKLEAELLRIRRSGGEACYAMLDLDHFKRINDTYGHASGDTVIKSLSRMLQQRLRRSDIIGRCGGEEFGILMPGCPIGNATSVLESLRQAFGQTSFSLAGKEVFVTLSGGLMRIEPSLTLDQLINSVDAALYDAKKQGRNRIVLA